ncbi:MULTISPECIES: pseudouridine synthase [Methylobacterium]|jgi:16S rRNA pseudouridine516 synthase|uniref:pseudouridine synthase n=1 Tax=Methylobacterium TaxID=407 RepID=UPI0008E32E48|nr:MULTISPECIES: pseudouridine synthase [Methylobacterium]MBZ6412882.1 rRNA pseudouridine synthase [Methylobacterium sp.]MBK3397991.1 rRNA pseudouridine synthase [Methylobacterium ajmalii]MBK3411977.1 rRNA pseudouridine synthase [Methylobacterium ajmalii]MBK3424675.1 rRNA pseudouridine synthase [Methylobacterium ajmalii]SFE09919.1 16S rRNA pseudouridine516 synthase [Methylobacterium sp. yr596]
MSGKAKVPSVRLDRLLANLGYGSRREIQMLARAGTIVLDGATLLDADRRIALDPDLPARLTVQTRPLDPLPGVALMLHKPLGVTCSHKEAGPLVYGLLPPRWRRREPPLSTVGRLDKETSGLLLLTDDGALLHRIISPKASVSKRYQVTLDRPLRGDEGAIFSSGTLMLEGEEKPLLPVDLEVHGPTSAAVTLTEGRYHQVRRMFAAVGNHVTALHRDRVGALDLPADLEPGQYRVMGEEDVARVFGQG